MMFRSLLALTAIGSVLACPEHNHNLNTRAETTDHDWNYDDPSTWGSIKPEYATCSTGTQQSPIDLPATLSTTHVPTFKYTSKVAGALTNWGYGPSFAPSGAVTSNPSFVTNGTTYYLLGFHTHTTSEHTMSGLSTKAELHLVHGDSSGAAKGVIGIPLTTGAESPFWQQILKTSIPGIASTNSTALKNVDMGLAIKEAGNLKKYWTYKGSLTTPPCTEGKRWWVSGVNMQMSLKQMDLLLKASDFSSRGVQSIKAQALGI